MTTRTLPIATADQLIELGRHAVNAITREIAETGCTMTYEQSDALGDATKDWMRKALDLRIDATGECVECTPRLALELMAGVTEVLGHSRVRGADLRTIVDQAIRDGHGTVAEVIAIIEQAEADHESDLAAED